MTDLEFRITIVPRNELYFQEKDQLLSQVKSAIERCRLTSVSVQYCRGKISENEDYLEIEELKFQIRGTKEALHHTSKVQLYEELRLNWNSFFRSFHTSYIEFYSNDSFVKCKHHSHELTYDNITFGVLPHNGTFHQFASLRSDIVGENPMKFYHDTRNVVINIMYPFIGEFEITFSYQNIRNIFINIENNPSKIYFDLFNPPIIFRIETDSLTLKSTRHRNTFSSVLDSDVLGRANVLCLAFQDPVKILEIISRIHHQCCEKSVYYTFIRDVSKTKPADPNIGNIDFDSTYLITAMLRRNFILASQTTDIDNNLKRLKDLSQQNPEALEKALTVVLVALDSGKILNFWKTIESQYIYYTSNEYEVNFKDYIVPSKCSMIRRIILTPTRQLLWPKEIMMSNRVLRNFDAEYSIRVSFREDNMSRLSYNAIHADAEVLESCIKKPMTVGIIIGSRKYEFLGWSNSQIRDHGVWMYARDNKDHTAAAIRQWMGNFSHIRTIPKYMARMGQCFSQTEDALSVPLDPRFVRMEDDIERGYDAANDKPYCFSDGVGRISAELASQVHKALGHDKLCSAFQIRYGGCKGMLVIDPTLEDAQIVFRKSMKKFECPNSTSLEIARTSSPVPLYLNRPFITLLNGLGVRHRTFLRLQEVMLNTLTEMLYEESVAAEFLQSNTPTDLYNFKDLSKSGIHLTTEPFFKSMLLALHRHRIEKIKSRASVAIDPSKGRNMLGVIDETNSLNYGQVFVQYSKDVNQGGTTNDTIIHIGEVLVTKNPCMYPGDVRKFKAVNIDALHHIVDCIVFPQRGDRPHPNEMAGSDLDGDEYVVLWDPDLIFHDTNYPAADFPAVECKEVSRITVSDMITFLQDYITSDQVGSIASAHLARADQEGIFAEICMTLAKKFFIAVDFPKSGTSEHLERYERPIKYPDFMENENHRMYKSKNALGKMYRICRDFESENEVSSISYANIKVDPDLVYNGWEAYKNDALKSRNKYNALFRSVLRNYGIQHEAEALSNAFTNLHCRFHERRDRNEIEKIIIGCIKKLNKCMFEEFMEEFSNDDSINTVVDAMLQKASAWYVVTYSDPNAKFLSFPWAVSKYLANIKIMRYSGKLLPFSPAVMDLDQRILSECETAKYLLLPFEESRVLNDYHISCDPLIVRRALHTLVLWAQQEEIVVRPEKTAGLLYMDVFVKLFCHVSEKLGYISKLNSSVEPSKKQYSSAQLCLEFLKYCSTFRFYNPFEMANILPFDLYKYNRLAKCAIVSYHKFALSGKLQTLNLEEELILVGKPMYIDADVFSSYVGFHPTFRPMKNNPIDSLSLRRAEEALIAYSRVNELSLREIRQKKKVCVSATGTEKSLKALKYILRKKHVLRKLITTGIMPALEF